jgi:hypothetical protein
MFGLLYQLGSGFTGSSWIWPRQRAAAWGSGTGTNLFICGSRMRSSGVRASGLPSFMKGLTLCWGSSGGRPPAANGDPQFDHPDGRAHLGIKAKERRRHTH